MRLPARFGDVRWGCAVALGADAGGIVGAAGRRKAVGMMATRAGA